MFNIADYLKKFTHLEGDLVSQREIIAKALKEVCGLDAVDFEIKKGTLYVKTNSMARSIVFMKKDQIVEYLRQNFPKGRVSDVR